MVRHLINQKNYYQSEEEKSWPERRIVETELVENRWDFRGGTAVKATLECGHSCFLTGEAIMGMTLIHCKPCGESRVEKVT